MFPRWRRITYLLFLMLLAIVVLGKYEVHLTNCGIISILLMPFIFLPGHGISMFG